MLRTEAEKQFSNSLDVDWCVYISWKREARLYNPFSDLTISNQALNLVFYSEENKKNWLTSTLRQLAPPCSSYMRECSRERYSDTVA
jgi:hypothetical protein